MNSAAQTQPAVPGRSGDVIAGLSVAAIAIPQALAYAEIAGMPMHVGLYAAAIPPILAGVFASSRYLQTGPVAMTSLLVFGALVGLDLEPQTAEFIHAGMLLALIVGVVRVVLGLMNAGILAYLMSQPVLLGFSSAAAILIVASQIELLLGLPKGDGALLARAGDALRRPADWSLTALAIGGGTMVIIMAGKRVHRLFPGILLAVIIGTVVNRWFHLPVETLGDIPEGLPSLPDTLPWNKLRQLLIPGGVIALVGFAEPAAIARTLAAQSRQSWDPDREFISQGVANLSAGLCGAFPVGGSFSRSSVAKLAGARSRLAGMISGMIVFAVLPFAGVLGTLPKAVLGGIVVVATARLIRIPALLRLIRVTWGQSIVAWGTFISTLTFAPRVDLGLVTGIALATAIHLRRESMIQLRAEVDGAGTLLLMPSGVLYFGSAPRLSQTLVEQLAAHADISRVTVDLGKLGRVDYTGAVELQAFVEECRSADLGVTFRNIPRHAQGTMSRCFGRKLDELLVAGN